MIGSCHPSPAFAGMNETNGSAADAKLCGDSCLSLYPVQRTDSSNCIRCKLGLLMPLAAQDSAMNYLVRLIFGPSGPAEMFWIDALFNSARMSGLMPVGWRSAMHCFASETVNAAPVQFWIAIPMESKRPDEAFVTLERNDRAQEILALAGAATNSD